MLYPEMLDGHVYGMKNPEEQKKSKEQHVEKNNPEWEKN